jgi:hypothetical protein
MATDPKPSDPAASSTDANDDQPSLRQKLHAATGDRDAEAKALADRSEADVSEADAKAAVERAHGDVHGEPRPENDVASPDDAKAVRGEETSSR